MRYRDVLYILRRERYSNLLRLLGVLIMTITYTIWQGSLMKGTLTAKSMKEIIALIDELNEVKPSLKFTYLVHTIEQENK